jgi:hypothetical protein
MIWDKKRGVIGPHPEAFDEVQRSSCERCIDAGTRPACAVDDSRAKRDEEC